MAAEPAMEAQSHQLTKTSVIPKAKNKIRTTTGEKIFNICNITLLLLLCLVTLYPFWYVLVLSFNVGIDAAKGPIWFWPRDFTWDNYNYVFHNPMIKSAFFVTIGRAILGSLFSICVMLLAAFALSKRFLPGRRMILYFLMIPMFISGSLISNYVVMVKLGLLNNFLVYIIPGAFSFFFMIIIRTFIEQIPEGVEESAMIDGAGFYQIFIKIIVPLCKPILAAMLFFSIVGHWLDFGTNLLYVNEEKLYVLQYVLYLVVIANKGSDMINLMQFSGTVPTVKDAVPTPEVLKMSTLMVVTLPLLFVYPFFQRFFIKGMMVGAIKA
ncbi:carbohydrate ABC transporter permease [Paenibacillus montanisoli]|uniref:Carbohydrate ABC transporter permease n=1 Tax=Paenibacillus montanisoli TaxID=2081970 RepID=A0A328U736_9BACL|nr:carbohydrate ABC transporter permease [Paenibacillus montanisoli]RAP77892.1 carbohydrate ABC transporter permease [Paenibacillus montanisoli]